MAYTEWLPEVFEVERRRYVQVKGMDSKEFALLLLLLLIIIVLM
jgi:hypothetical protein